MQKTFEILTVLMILCFLGVILWQVSNIDKSSQSTKIESSESYQIHEAEATPVLPEKETTEEVLLENILEIGIESNQPIDDKLVTCPTDAKLCLDGSYVGRVGPDCEFEACSEEAFEPVDCTMDVRECPDGSFVGRSAPDCEFEKCPVLESLTRYGEDVSLMEEYREDCENRGGIFNECDSACGPEAEVCMDVCSMTCLLNETEEDIYLFEKLENPEKIFECSDSFKSESVGCIMLYAPVCGNVEVQCFSAPCNPVQQTFSNSCIACSTNNVISYTEGECLSVNK